MPQIKINLKSQLLKQIQNYSVEHDVNGDQVIPEALNQFFEDDYIEEYDELLDKAKKIAIEFDQPTASLLQRKLKVGYARADRLLRITRQRQLS